MNELLFFFSEVWSSFHQKDGVDQIAIAATLLLPFSIPFFGWIFGIRTWQTRKQLLEREIVGLEKARAKAEAERDRAQRELADWQPLAWLKMAKQNRRDENEELAIRSLSEGVEKIRYPLSVVCGARGARVVPAPLGKGDAALSRCIPLAEKST